MQTIPQSGLRIQPSDTTEGYDEQKDLVERGSRKIQNTYVRYDGFAGGPVVRAVPTEEKGTLFTVFVSSERLEFGLYKNGSIVQDMVYGHPPIRIQHLERLCDRVENDIRGLLKYKDDPAIEKAWETCFEKRNEEEFAKAVENMDKCNMFTR